MKTIPLKLKENSYKIVIGDNLLSRAGELVRGLSLGKDAVIITNPLINRLYGARVSQSLKRSGFSVKTLTVPDGEESKSAKVAYRLMEDLAQYDILKNIFIVALGGGVIGDLAGYVAAAYKRGVPYIQVPTTFLAQIDSSIGGKVAIDLSVGKNLVGAFHQPKIVISDVSVLKTLDERQMRNGLAEAVKYGVINDPKLFKYLEINYAKVIKRDAAVLNYVVARCSQIKTNVVAADEKETKNIRTILNFGHTIGHAVEAAGKFKLYHHGEAIALGMRVAAEISVRLNAFSRHDQVRLNNLLTAIGLPQKIKSVKKPDILRLMYHDKKFISGKTRFVLVQKIGRVNVVDGVSVSAIEKAVNAYLQPSA